MLTPEGIQGLLDMMGRQHTQIVVLSREVGQLRAELQRRDEAEKAKPAARKRAAKS